MIKKVWLLFAVNLLLCSISIGANNGIPTHVLPTNSCTAESAGDVETVDMYLTNDYNKDGVKDDWIILNNWFKIDGTTSKSAAGYIMLPYNLGNEYLDDVDNTTVWYSLPESHMVKKANWDLNSFSSIDNSTFYRMSRIFPFNRYVRGIQTNPAEANGMVPSKILLQAPISDKNNDSVVFVYRYRYKTAESTYLFGTESYIWYNDEPLDSDGLPFGGNLTASSFHNTLEPYAKDKKRKWSSSKTEANCYVVNLHWCGDGNTDSKTYDFGTNYTPEVCDDGDLNGTPGHCNSTCTAILPPDNLCGNGNIDTGEECDDGNTTDDGNGCSADCTLTTPICTLIVTPDSGDEPLSTTLTATMSSWASAVSLDYGDESTMLINNPTFPRNHTYNTPSNRDIGRYTAVLTVRNNYQGTVANNVDRPTYICRDTVTVNTPVAVCGDGNLDTGEECDDGNITDDGNGCSASCTLTTPTCTLTASPTSGYVPLTVTFDSNLDAWVDATNLSFGDGSSDVTDPTFTLDHDYTDVGNYTAILTVENNYNGSINGTRPSDTCDVDVTTQSPNFVVRKENAHDADIYNVGDLVTFNIYFGNHGDYEATDVVVSDVLPVSLEYVSSEIHYLDGTAFSPAPTRIVGSNNDSVMYTGIIMDAHTTGIMILTGRVRASGCSNDGINNLNTGLLIYGSLVEVDTALYNCAEGVVVNKYQSVQPGVWTSDIVMVEPYDFIGYRIDFENVGGTAVSDLHVYDALPTGVQYISSYVTLSDARPISTGTTNGIDWVDTNTFSLAPGQTGSLYITGQIVSGFDTVGTIYTNIANISGSSDSVDALLTGNDPELWLEKEVLGHDSGYSSGDLVGFRVVFGNSGLATAENLVIEDIFPGSLSYDGNFVIVDDGGNATCTTSNNNGTLEVICSNIQINGNSSGYLLLTGQIIDETCISSVNGAFFSGTNIGDTAMFMCGAYPYAHKYQNVTGVYTDDMVQVGLGSGIEYRIEFGNMGGEGTTGVVINDILSLGVHYLTSDIAIFSGGIDITDSLNISFGTGDTGMGDSMYIQYSGFDLDAGWTGVLYISGVISTGRNYSVYTNYLTIEFDNPYVYVESNQVVAVRGFVDNILFTKTVVDSSGNNISVGGIPYFFSGDDVYFHIQIVNLGDEISEIILTDLWPDDTCTSFDGWRGTGFIQNGSDLEWTYNGVLQFSDTADLRLSGHILSDGVDCIGTHANTGLVDYVMSGDMYTGETVALFDIRDMSLILRKTSNISGAIHQGDYITFYLYFENNGTTDINDLVVSDVWPGTLDLITLPGKPFPFDYNGPLPMSYSASDITGGQLLQWTIDSTIEPGMTGMIILTGQLVR